jgi:hypothetical protein
MPDIFISEQKEKEEKKESVIAKEKVEVFEKPKMTTEKPLIDIPIDSNQSVLSAFLYRPKKVQFEAKESEEKVILLLRQHPIVNLKWIFPLFLLLVAPIVAGSFPIFEFMPKNFQFIGVLAWYLVSFAFGIQGFLNWYFNVYIVTDERIIDIDFHNLIYKEVSDANIDKIQDVTYRMGGVIRTMFNYGDILIQTASERPNFEFSAVPKPDKVAKILQDLRLEEQQEALEGRIR